MDWMKMLDDEKPDWMTLTAWWARQFYLIADTNAGVFAVNAAMAKMRST